MNEERPSLTIVRRIKASPANVYAAWTRREVLARWWGPDGGPVRGSGPRHPNKGPLVTVDLRTIPGGAEFVLAHTRFDDETTHDSHRRGWNGAFDKLEALFAQSVQRITHGTA